MRNDEISGRTSLLAPYAEDLRVRADESRLRRCRIVEPVDSDLMCDVDGKPAIHFCGNDYLGLSSDDRLKQAAIEAVARYGTGSGASRLVSGTSELVVALETALAEFKDAEAALVLNSGYQANVAILQAILDKDDWVFCDKWNHASLVDGCLLSGARWTRYRHTDLNHLESRLKVQARQTVPGAKKWIVTDSVFSMDGDHARLVELMDLAERYDALVMLDEAHGTGLFGEKRASGLAELAGVSKRVTLQMGTLSKALGGFGAYVAGPRMMMDTLVNKARGFIYSTALPPAVLGAALKAVEVVRTDSAPRTRLWENAAYLLPRLTKVLEDAGLPSPFDFANFVTRAGGGTGSQIIPIVLRDDHKTLNACEKLLDAGYFVQAIRPPTVPQGTARLRMTLSARHTRQQMDGFLNALEAVLANLD